MDIGIISEGVTDQIVIEAIVQGYLNDRDVILDELQPKKGAPGGWPLVISYCKSKDFRESFPYKQDGFTIVHIDCDILKGDGTPQDCRLDFNGLDIEASYDVVRNKLIEFFGFEDFEEISHKIVFAIAVDTIECWFLPIYFGNKPAVANKVSGCINTLNKVLEDKEGFYIDAKDEDNYRKIAKHFRKPSMVTHCCKMNESFGLFIDSLKTALEALN